MPFKLSVQNSDLKLATDAQLFELMKNSELDSEGARMAWSEFYKRYAAYLWNCCLKVCKNAPEGQRLSADIFQSTMQKVFNHSRTFQPEKGTGIKSWISRIAHNEFIDHYNKYNANFSSYDAPPDIEDNSFAEEIEGEDENESDLKEKLLSIRSEQLNAILAKLTKKEFKILMTCMNFYQIDKPNAHLPDSEMNKLCEEFNVKSDAIRQIKRRALLKLQKFAKEL